ncbi:MAG: hypothetical protein ACP5N0_03110 [Methanosarcina sp.]|uniref:hypothetical protein n=1 Tax=Methanosarcina sp. TaxID=2213 RepID=UPI003BB6B3C0
MNHDITRDRKIEEDENYEGKYPELREILFPETDSMLYSILNSLNNNIANFYAYMKFKDYISENSLDMELLQRSMSIHRDFSALFLHTKEELVFVYPELLEKAEKLLFKGEAGTDIMKYTSKMCKIITDYKMTLYREGYLPDLKTQLLLANI